MTNNTIEQTVEASRHLALVKAVRQRGTIDEFGYGLCTADLLVSRTIDELGTGGIRRYATAAGPVNRKALIKRAARQLTYSEKDMAIEMTASPGAFATLVPSGVQVPPHTMMVIRNVLTTPSKDRDGDTLRSEGARIDPRGPLLWQHMFNIPLGKHLAVVEQNEKWVKEVNCLLDLKNEISHDAAILVESQALRFSHGFQAEEWKELKGRTDRPCFDISKYQVLERSLVSVPSNPDAIIELYSRGKLCSAPLKRKARALYDSRQKVFAGVTFATSEPIQADDVPRWNKSIHAMSIEVPEPFDVPSQKLAPRTLLYDWCSKYCGCEIKNLTETGEKVPTVRMGSWLTAFEDWKQTGVTLNDVRNINGDTESPPRYEEIMLNSKQKSRFLVDGTLFVQDSAGAKFVITFDRGWGGIEVSIRCHKNHLDACLKMLEWVKDRASTYKFLKGEKFSLTGEFLEPSGDSWENLFLDAHNEKPLKLATRLLNEKAAAMPNRGIMMMGPPGTGKTLAGRVMMGECKDATFIWVAAKDFYQCGTFGGICGALEMARELAPAIVFLEDIDNWMDGRGVDLMKSELDGIARYRGVLTIMTTNYPERMDKALIDRPGRFHDVLMFNVPSDDTRRRMLDVWMPDAAPEQLERVAEETKSWSGAHVYELCQFAKTLQETEQLPAGEALTKSVEKIMQQRDLIDSAQSTRDRYPAHRRSAKAVADDTAAACADMLAGKSRKHLPGQHNQDSHGAGGGGTSGEGTGGDDRVAKLEAFAKNHGGRVENGIMMITPPKLLSAGQGSTGVGPSSRRVETLDDGVGTVQRMMGKFYFVDRDGASQSLDSGKEMAILRVLKSGKSAESEDDKAKKPKPEEDDAVDDMDGEAAEGGGEVESEGSQKPRRKPRCGKAGRVLSQRNLDAINDCLADIEEAIGMIENMPRGASALVQRALIRLKDVIESASAENVRPDDKPKETDTKSAFLLVCEMDHEELNRLKQYAEAELRVRQSQTIATQFRSLKSS